MRNALALAYLIPLAACGASSAAPASAPQRDGDPDPPTLVAEARRLAASDLWPGFDAAAIPVAVFDGERTLLFGHPAPPPPFEPLPGSDAVAVHPGRHPAVTANSSAEIGGVLTATVLTPSLQGSVTERAGLLIHEMFHVHQRARHPGWGANEAELFAYPAADPELLRLRRQETEALRRALGASHPPEGLCWTAAALELREQRFASLTPGAAAYEREVERHEGLAAYVEARATGLPDARVLPESALPATAVRQRAYRTGLALGRLLDRYSPGWRSTLTTEDERYLDELLRSAVAARVPAERCVLGAAEVERIRAEAAAEVESLAAERAGRRARFLERQGWTIVVEAAAAPLFPQGFDPLNVTPIGGGEVLHTRFLRLGNALGWIEVMGRESLSAAAGPHPLFTGVRELSITGLEEEPAVLTQEGRVRIDAEGVTAELRAADVSRSGRTLRVRLPGGG